MKRIAFLLLAFCQVVTGQQSVGTKPVRVTVFTNGAQVERIAEVDIAKGTSTLKFSGLSPYMDAKSLRLSGTGNVTILSVSHRFCVPDSAARSQQQKRIAADIAALQSQIDAINDKLSVVTAEKAYLRDNSKLGGSEGGATMQQIRDFGMFYSNRLTELNAQERKLKSQLSDLDLRMANFRAESGAMNDKTANRASEILVEVSAAEACKSTVGLTYFTENASWIPSYDIRSASVDADIMIGYKATVRQNTGEEWKDIQLVLSTSMPSKGNTAPQLQTYYLGQGYRPPVYSTSETGNIVSGTVRHSNGKPLAAAQVTVKGSTIATLTDADGNYSIAVPDMGAATLQFAYVGCATVNRRVNNSSQINVVLRDNQSTLADRAVAGASGGALRSKRLSFANAAAADGAVMVEESVEEESWIAPEVAHTAARTSLEFQFTKACTLPSSNKSLSVTIGNYSLPSEYTYYCTPKVDNDAFLTAQIVNDGSLDMVDGEANVYFENTFVGKTVVMPASAGDTLKISLGRDKNLQVKRLRQTTFTKRSFIGSNCTDTRAWEITVSNNKKQPVQLTLHDQIPVSAESDIEVTAEDLSGGKLNSKNGTVTWNLTLQPGEKQKLLLRYKVKYPKNKQVFIE